MKERLNREAIKIDAEIGYREAKEGEAAFDWVRPSKEQKDVKLTPSEAIAITTGIIQKREKARLERISGEIDDEIKEAKETLDSYGLITLAPPVFEWEVTENETYYCHLNGFRLNILTMGSIDNKGIMSSSYICELWDLEDYKTNEDTDCIKDNMDMFFSPKTLSDAKTFCRMMYLDHMVMNSK